MVITYFILYSKIVKHLLHWFVKSHPQMLVEWELKFSASQ